jgi:hypothetical protein
VKQTAALGLLPLLLLTGCASGKHVAGSLKVVTVKPPTTTVMYTVPSSSMEPTLHCAGAPGCLAQVADRVQVESPPSKISRGDVIAFHTPPAALTHSARAACSSSA